jgi:hypothetical protein
MWQASPLKRQVNLDVEGPEIANVDEIPVE